MESLIVGVVVLFSLLVHEYGHALTAVYFGASPVITLEAFGGNARYNGYGMSDKQRFLITLGGPLLESILIALSYYLLEMDVFQSYYIRYFLYVMMEMNILWVLLNLIPVVPLDGGHLARYFLEKWFGEKGQQISHVIGVYFVVLIAPYLFYLGYLFFGGFLLILGMQNYQALKKFKAWSGESTYSGYLRALDAIKENDFGSAKTILKRLVKSDDKQYQHLSIEALAKIYVQENEPKQAYKLLLNADHTLLKEGKSLLCKLAFDEKNDELISKYSMDIYAIEPTFEIAVLNSKAFARLNKAHFAGAWLYTASQFGPEYREKVLELVQTSLYDKVRDQGPFQDCLAKI